MRHLNHKKINSFTCSITRLGSFLLLSAFLSTSNAFADLSLTVEVDSANSVRLHSNCFEWDNTIDKALANDNSDGTWTVTLAGENAWEATCEYKWMVDGVEEDLTQLSDQSCAPINGTNYDVNGVAEPFANRVWVVGSGDVSDKFESCDGHVPYAYDVTYTLTAPDANSVRMTGNIDPWNWDPETGPEASDNGDGTWTVTLENLTVSFEYLWVVNGVMEDLTSQVAAADPCEDTGLALQYGEESALQAANRQWNYGDGATLNETFDEYTCLDGSAVTFELEFFDEYDLQGEVPTVNGTFNNWCGSCAPMEYSEDDGVWTLTTRMADGNYDFKYAIGAWVDEEDVPGSCSNSWGNRTFTVAGEDITISNLYGICRVDTDGDGVEDHLDDDDDNDFVEDINDPVSLDDEYFDINMVTMSNVFGGNEHEEDHIYRAPAEGSSPSVMDWAGFANSNESLYPLDFSNGGVISFVASVVNSDEAVEVYFELQDKPAPDTDVVVAKDLLSVEVSGATPTKYSVDVPANATPFNNLIMDLEDNNVGVKITDIAIGHTQSIIVTGDASSVTISYDTSDDSATDGLGLRIHFDSSVLTPTAFSNSLGEDLSSFPVLGSPSADTQDFDGMSVTDSYFEIQWEASGATWPSTLPADLLTINFDVAETEATDAVIGFSRSSVSDYVFNAGRELVEIPSGTGFDLDGNGETDALTDGILFLRHLFNLSGNSLIRDAVKETASRTTAEEIAEYIDFTKLSFGDIDGNGETDALTDGILLLRHLFNLSGNSLIRDAVKADASRTTAADIAAHIDANRPELP